MSARSWRSDSPVEVVALCPFTVGTVVWQPQAGAWTLTACVKGTFKLDHGRDLVLDERQEAVADDRYCPDNPRGSLYAPSDLVPFKPRGDVTLVGHAYAPRARPVEALVARLCVGELDKALGVVGDRVWKEGPDGLEPAAPEPFVKMPLRYERAARGPDNPVGLDLTAAPVSGALALPNLEPVEDDAASGRTVGFGPISAAWRSRSDLLAGTQSPAPLAPLPQGFDFGYYNAAPRDQQVDLLRANARLVLENLHPRHGRLETRIPSVRPKAFLVDARGKATEIALRCDTIWIDTDRGTMALTWRGLTGVESADAASVGTLVVAIESKGKEIRYKLIENLFREGALASLGTDDLATEERNPMGVRHDSIKPTAPPPPVLPPRSPLERPPRDRRREASRSSPPAAPVRHAHAAAVFATAVPQAPRAAAIELALGSSGPEESTQTDVITDRIQQAAAGGSEPPRPPDAAPRSGAAPETVPHPRGQKPREAASDAAGRADELAAPRHVAASTTAAEEEPQSATTTDPASEDAEDAQRTQRAERAPAPTLSADADAAGGGGQGRATGENRSAEAPVAADRSAVASPPAHGERGEREDEAAAAHEASAWRDVAGHQAPESPRAAMTDEPARDEIDLDRYAEISAELGAEGARPEAVLAAHTLDAQRWRAIDERWKSQLRVEGAAVSTQFDAATRAALERLRAADSIRVADFVRVQRAAEQGDAGRALAEIGMAPGDLSLLRRVWERRAESDPDVAKALAEAFGANTTG